MPPGVSGHGIDAVTNDRCRLLPSATRGSRGTVLLQAYKAGAKNGKVIPPLASPLMGGESYCPDDLRGLREIAQADYPRRALCVWICRGLFADEESGARSFAWA